MATLTRNFGIDIRWIASSFATSLKLWKAESKTTVLTKLFYSTAPERSTSVVFELMMDAFGVGLSPWDVYLWMV